MSISVSVIVPVYNVAPYLRECMESLCRQTLQELEFICIDDGSTDESPAILAEFARRDSRIRIISQENGGVAAARNAGLDAARGQYVGFVDPDDSVSPFMFERTYSVAREHDADVVECGGAVESDDLVVCMSFDYMLRSKCSIDTHFHFSDLGGVRPVMWLKLIRRELLEKYRLRFEPSLSIGEDVAFLAFVFPHCRRVVTIPDRLYFYRPLRPNSITEKYKNETWAIHSCQAHLDVALAIGAYWREAGCFQQAGASLIGWTFKAIQHTFPKLPRALRREMFLSSQKVLEQLAAASFVQEVPQVSSILQGRYWRFVLPQLCKRWILCSRLFMSVRSTLLRMVVSSFVQEKVQS